MVDEYLGLVFKPSESGGVNYPVTITLEFGAASGRRLFEPPAPGSGWVASVGSEFMHLLSQLPALDV